MSYEKRACYAKILGQFIGFCLAAPLIYAFMADDYKTNQKNLHGALATAVAERNDKEDRPFNDYVRAKYPEKYAEVLKEMEAKDAAEREKTHQEWQARFKYVSERLDQTNCYAESDNPKEYAIYIANGGKPLGHKPQPVQEEAVSSGSDDQGLYDSQGHKMCSLIDSGGNVVEVFHPNNANNGDGRLYDAHGNEVDKHLFDQRGNVIYTPSNPNFNPDGSLKPYEQRLQEEIKRTNDRLK